MTDVTIPADDAAFMGTYLAGAALPSASDIERFRGLVEKYLTPKPPTLREKVAQAMRATGRSWIHEHEAEFADAVLAVIADEMAKRPLTGSYVGDDVKQRDADLVWLRGEQS